jgi:acetylornithine deacetylase/succinyl-diaminopimelate desuccinylase-like protein
MDLQAETQEVLRELIRFDTVNPPGNERALQEWLKAYLEEAGLHCELAGADPERPNLVARLEGEQPGPVLGYLSHVDTVLADAGDWTHDPWGGEVHDGFLYGRGALDMKNQTAAEVVAAAHLARRGWRPPRGELRVFSVVDEEVGGHLGARWLCAERPDLARCDYLLNEGGGARMPLGDGCLYGVEVAEKGVLRFKVVAEGRAAHASVPAFGENALLKLAPVLERFGSAPPRYEPTEQTRALLEGLGQDPDDPAAAVEALRAGNPRLADLVASTLGLTFSPTVISASEKINVIPARAEVHVDCRMPPGMESDRALEQIREIAGDGVRVEPMEETVGNGSPPASPLFDAIRDWIGERDPDAGVIPIVLPAYTDSRAWREAFPECIAYGWFPHRHMSLFDTWPLMHASDERIDVRDLGFAAEFFSELPGRLLA